MAARADRGARASKSAAKRAAADAQRLGAALAALAPARCLCIPMSAALRDALNAYQTFSSREARRRQLQFIGRLMREEDREAIAAGLARATGSAPADQARHRLLESWCERLLAEPPALAEYLRAWPGADAQALRQLLRRHRQTPDAARRAALRRQLLRLLRENAANRSAPRC